jgi:hypothetical protein
MVSDTFFCSPRACRDVPLLRARGVRDRALSEHRESPGRIPSLFPLFLSPVLEGGGQGCPRLRASNESRFIWSISSIWFIWLVGLEIHPKELDRPERPANQTDQPVRVPRAKKAPGLFASPTSSSLVLEAGTHVVPTARVQRGPSQGARCASTGATWVSCLSSPTLASASPPPVQCPRNPLAF